MSTLKVGAMPQNSTLLQEQRAEGKIEIMKARKADRLDRFLNARERTIGLDVSALDQQVAEKRERKMAERQADIEYAREQRRVAQVMSEYEKSLLTERQRRVAMDAEAARIAGMVESETSKLNDPHALKKEQPARMGDQDTRCGPASLQRFDGEDLRAGERRALQAVQMRRWTEDAHAAKVAKAEAEAEEEALYMQGMHETHQRVQQYEDTMAAEARRRTTALAQENLRLAAASKAAAAEARRAEQAGLKNAHEIPGLIDEHVSDRQSRLGPNRVRPDTFRGMSQREHAAVLEEQRRQAEEAAARKLAERKAEWEDARRSAEVAQQVAQYEKSAQQEEARRRAQYQADLARQVAERQAAAAAEREAAKQPVNFEGGFFGGFGKSDR